jgi:glutamine synthetase
LIIIIISQQAHLPLSTAAEHFLERQLTFLATAMFTPIPFVTSHYNMSCNMLFNTSYNSQQAHLSLSSAADHFLEGQLTIADDLMLLDGPPATLLLLLL